VIISEHGPLPDIDTADLPDWMSNLVAATADLDPSIFRRFSGSSTEQARDASVLMLFGTAKHGTAPHGPDLLFLRRADSLGAHPGQVAFPGGGSEPGDAGPVETALREAEEEVGVDPDGVRPLARLPRAYVPVSGFDVTPVLAYWDRPSSVRAVDEAETAAVARVPIAHLVDPANRIQVRHPSGFTSPAYLAPGMLIWGFTAGLLTVLLSIGGWDRPWDATKIVNLDDAWLMAREVGTRSGQGGGAPAAPASADGNVPPAIAEV
jgi:8-oxo-dGTP pyrophosphatase MutT (NUDIX family)